MRCAVFTATLQGVQVARKIRTSLDASVTIFRKAGQGAADNDEQVYERLSDAVTKTFSQYEALIFVMAAGIAVRMIAPHVVSKLQDPAVVVMDEQAVHVISLLSGHIGGANALTLELAKVLMAEPVITTATDVEGKIAADVVAGRLGLRPWPKEQIKVLNAEILQGGRPVYYIDTALKQRMYYKLALTELGLTVRLLPAAAFTAVQGMAVFLTAQTALPVRSQCLYLQPCRLIAGIGCRRGVAEPVLRQALQDACTKIGRSLEDVDLLASTEVKKDEAGLRVLAKTLQKDIRFFSNAVMQDCITHYGLQTSAFVERTIGIGNVAEAAALCCVKAGRIALGKTKFSKVTVALVWEK